MKNWSNPIEAELSDCHTRLLRQTNCWFTRARAALLETLPCSRGCFRCCVGPFPITVLDAHLLRDGLDRLPSASRQAIQHRAMAQIEQFEQQFPALRISPFLDQWDDSAIDQVTARFHEAPCPALQEDGSCGVYEVRPLTCRLMGIPTSLDGIVQGACEIQSFVPITRLSTALREEESALATAEAAALTLLQQASGLSGEEFLLPYGFLPELLFA